MRARVGALLLATAGVVSAQLWEPEIRRAEPVVKPSPTATPKPEPPVAPAVPFDNPAWMNRVQPPPAPSPRGRIEVAPTPPPAPAPGEGEIRLSPNRGNDAAQADLDTANSVYARKMYDYATMEYEKFLVAHPSAPGRDMALFRLAECHRMLGNEEPARENYERLLREFQKGEFAGAAAFRLGEYLYAEKKFDPAVRQFQLAAGEAANDEIRLTAKYNLARSLDQLKRRPEAARIYEEVAAVEKNNPYYDYARLSLAGLAAESGNKKDAADRFEKIARSGAPSAVRAEAGVKAASLAAELGDGKRAVALFDLVIRLPDAGDWKPVAVVGAVRVSYDLGDYAKVASHAEKPLDDIPEESRAEVLLMAGNSYRQLGNARAARAVYDRLLLQFPDSPSSQNARFHRLVTMYQAGDPNIVDEADKFLAKATDPKERAQVNLLKAEALFKAKQFDKAAPIYAQVAGTPLSAELKTQALYKLGWCQVQSGDSTRAIQTFTEYVEKNPKAANAASAIVQRGIARQQAKDFQGALKDFDLILEKYPGADREFALQQKALLLGQEQDYKGMTAAFRQLLADYPKSAGTAQANFWLGWAAFEEKDYKAAITSLETARKLDPAQYGERAALRIVLCHYYLEDRAALVRSISENKNVAVPVEITRWLGRKSYEEADYVSAERFLLPAAKDLKTADPQVLIELAEAQIRLGKTREAAPYVAKYLETAREPYSRARALLAKASIAIGQREFDDARKLCDEALLLQPEGRLNAEARLVSGEIAFAGGDFDGAARAFMTVAVLYDDASVTPRALSRAAISYRKANNLLESEKAQRELQQRYPDFQKTPKISKGNP